jgi:hypothetical protein
VQAPISFHPQFAVEFPLMQAPISFQPLAIEFPLMQAPISFQPLVASSRLQLQATAFFWSPMMNNSSASTFVTHHSCVMVFPMASHRSSHSTGADASGHIGKPTQLSTSTGVDASGRIGKPTQLSTPTSVRIHQHRNANISLHRF